MKNLYKTPEITVEELTKQDVLCASNETPADPDNFSLFDSVLQDFVGS